MKRDKTKIICTLSMNQSDETILTDMILKGMDVARLNFSHASYDDAEHLIKLLKKIRDKLRMPVAIMLDTKGPECRIYGIDKPLTVETGDHIIVESHPPENIENYRTSAPNHFVTNLPFFHTLVKEGDRVLLADGQVECRVHEISGEKVFLEAKNKGGLRNKAHLNVPGLDYPMPFLSDKDIKDIQFAVAQDLDFIALSFVRDSDDLFKVRDVIYDADPDSQIQLISKIEHRKAIDNLDELIHHSDGIMVARGDLGVELDIEEVPIMQKKIIRDCYLAGKPVIVATQMLESMIDHRIPTRAEVSDVANACFDLASAVMLSGETAIGKYPLLVVETMQRIIEKVEDSYGYEDFLKTQLDTIRAKDLTGILTVAAVSTAYRTKAKALVVFTKTGYSARMLSRLRPGLPLYAVTLDEKVYNQLAISWGVTPVMIEDDPDFEILVKRAISELRRESLVERDDNLVIVASVPLGLHGRTNMIRVEIVK